MKRRKRADRFKKRVQAFIKKKYRIRKLNKRRWKDKGKREYEKLIRYLKRKKADIKAFERMIKTHAKTRKIPLYQMKMFYAKLPRKTIRTMILRDFSMYERYFREFPPEATGS